MFIASQLNAVSEIHVHVLMIRKFSDLAGDLAPS